MISQRNSKPDSSELCLDINMATTITAPTLNSQVEFLYHSHRAEFLLTHKRIVEFRDRSHVGSSISNSQHTSRISTVIPSSSISFSQHPRRISSSQPSNRISTDAQDSGSISRSQPCSSISLAPQQASRSSASQYSIPYRDSNIGADLYVSGSIDESSDLSTTGSEKTVSDALLKSDHQIMAEFLQDIQMLENL
ncbi:hypothetical protein M8J76_012612 [Diaphorina citri]|nr:hypothetical protein M8J76_012612 [Diaphorina citri]